MSPLATYALEGLGASAAIVLVLLVLSWMRSKPSSTSCLSEAARQNVVRIDGLKGERR